MALNRAHSLVQEDRMRISAKKPLQCSEGILSLNETQPMKQQRKEEQVESGKLQNAIEVGKGVGKGVYGRTVTATGKKISEIKGMVQNGKFFGATQYCKPGEPRYPKYNKCYSVKSVHEVAPLLGVTLENIPSSLCMIVGPDNGFLECIEDIGERRKYLKTQSKQLQQNPNANNETDTLSINELTAEEVKKKLNHLRTIEKKIKKIFPNLDILKSQDSRIFGRTIATYAFDCIKNERAGEPNADSFYAESFNNLIFFAVADGIGWGVPSRRASQSALLGFSLSLAEFYMKRKGYPMDTIAMAQACFNGIDMAHLSVYCNTESKTTFCGGILVELEHQQINSMKDHDLPFTDDIMDSDDDSDSDDHEKPSKKRWVFVGISVGDSLIYRYSSSSMEVTELTVSDRTGGVRDAGGCLGGKEPDLRNLTFHFCLANEGDIFIAVSDGVHDNLDPEVLKCSLDDVGYSGDKESWRDLDSDEKNIIKRKFKEEKLLEIIDNVDDLNPMSLTNSIMDYIVETTRNQREGYEQGSKLQRDWDKMKEQERNDLNKWVQDTLKNSIGKFDHVTCLCIQAGSK